MTKTYYVYLHRRVDTGVVFYVGCATKHYQKRGKNHQYSRAHDFTLRTACWLTERDSAGGVEVQILLETHDRNFAFSEEQRLIAKFGRCDLGRGILVNQTDGGSGAGGQIGTANSRHLKSIGKLGALNPMYGKTGANHPNSRKVRDRESGATFDSVQIAAEQLGFKMKTLYNWLSGHRKNPTSLEFA